MAKRTFRSVIALLLAMIMTVVCIPVSASAVNRNTVRYTVLVLDTSNEQGFLSGGRLIYTARTAIDYVKAASGKFLDDISRVKGKNYVAVINYQNDTNILSDFTLDTESLKSKINELQPKDNNRIISSALAAANTLFDQVTDPRAIKNVVLFTTGNTNGGEYSYTGWYDEGIIGSDWYWIPTGVNIYAYANCAIERSNILKENGVTVYTIGLFQTMADMPEEGLEIAEFFRVHTEDLASSLDTFHAVEDPEKLEFEFGEVAGDILDATAELEEVPVKYVRCGTYYDLTAYYDDSLFTNPASTMNRSLASVSAAFSMSCFNSEKGGMTDYSKKYSYAEEFLTYPVLGFSDVTANDMFTSKPTEDSVGVIAGHKTISIGTEDFTLVAVGVRGGEYERESGSNFLVGSSGSHEGFGSAGAKVVSFIRDYIARCGITGPVKIWLTGYGRGGAAANIAGASIGSGSSLGSGVVCGKDNIYVYCIEPPRTAAGAGASGYENIHNILDPNDIVTKLTPGSFGLGRYGSDHYLPSGAADVDDGTDRYAKMISTYGKIGGTSSYIINDFRMQKAIIEPGKGLTIEPDRNNALSLDLFINDFTDRLGSAAVKGRASYVSGLQSDFVKLYTALGSLSTPEQARFRSEFAKLLRKGISDVANTYSFDGKNGSVLGSSTEDTVIEISFLFEDALKEAKIKFSGYDQTDLAMCAGRIIAAALGAEPSYFATFIANSDIIAGAHSPEVCYAWLSTVDSNFFDVEEDGDPDDGGRRSDRGDHQIIHINCDVDITVFDSEGKPVAAIVNETPMKISRSRYVYGVDANGQKYVVLPVNEDYTVNITARNDDSVNYSISEYSGTEGKVVRTVSYFDVPMKKGQTITGTVPAYGDKETEAPEGAASKLKYTLTDSNGSTIAPDSDLTDAAVKTYNIVGTANDKSMGTVSGSGSYNFGTFAELTAIPASGCKFIGWYRNGTQVSTDAKLRICVTADSELTAMFRTDYEIKIKASASGTSATLTWNADTTAKNYEVYELKGSDYTLVSTVTEPVFTVDGLDKTERIFRVTAKYSDLDPVVSGDISVILPGLYLRNGSSVESFSGIDELNKKAASIKNGAGKCEILIGQSVSAKALTLPSGASGIRVKTLNSAVLTLSAKSLSIPADTVWDAETIASGLSLKGSAKASLTLLGSMTADNVNTFAKISAENGSVLTVTKKINGVSSLNGTIKLEAGASMAKSSFGRGELILTENAKGVLPKAAITDITGIGEDALTITVVNASGKAILLQSGTAVLTNEGKGSFTEKIKVTNKDTVGCGLRTFAYGKEIRAERVDFLTLYDGKIFSNYPNFNAAFSVMNKSGNYEITLYDNSEVGKFSLPGKYNSLVIDGGNNTFDLQSVSKINVACPIALRNMAIACKKSLTISTNSDIELSNISSKCSLSVKGSADAVINASNINVSEFDIDKFGTANVNGVLNVGKSLSVNTLNLGEMAKVNLGAKSSVSVKDLNGVYGSEIHVTPQMKKGIKISGKVSGGISFTGSVIVGKTQLLNTKSESIRKVFSVRGIYPAGSKDEYMLYQKGGKVTLEKTAFKVDGNSFCNWSDTVKYIEGRNRSAANYIVTLVGDHTEKSMKMPGYGKYGTLTIRSTGKTLNVKGFINCTKTTTFDNINIVGATGIKSPLGLIIRNSNIGCPVTAATKVYLTGENKIQGTVSAMGVASIMNAKLTLPRNCYLNVSLTGISGKLTLCIEEADGRLAPLPTGTVISQKFVGIYTSHILIGNPGYYKIKRDSKKKCLTLVYSSEPFEKEDDVDGTAAPLVSSGNTYYVDEAGDEAGEDDYDEEIFGFNAVLEEFEKQYGFRPGDESKEDPDDSDENSDVAETGEEQKEL